MGADEKTVKAQLCAEHGEGKVIFASHKALGLLAFRLPTEDEYLDFLGSVSAPLESTGIAKEQLCMDMMVHPTEKEARSKARRAMRAMPNMVTQIALAIESTSCGEYAPLQLDEQARADLDAKWEFGWTGIALTDGTPLILASDETSGTMVRTAIDARQNGDADNGRKVRQAVLSMIRSLDPDVAKALIADRPALLMPLWYRAQEAAGNGAVELGKD